MAPRLGTVVAAGLVSSCRAQRYRRRGGRTAPGGVVRLADPS